MTETVDPNYNLPLGTVLSNNSSTQKDYNSNPSNKAYVAQLETKIRQQASRLSELEKYKYLYQKQIQEGTTEINISSTDKKNNISDMQTASVLNYVEEENYMEILKKIIETDLLKNGIVNQYLTPENLIDFAKIKNECDEYRKQLVLAQSMINSLKIDLEEATKENIELKKDNERMNDKLKDNEICNNLNNNSIVNDLQLEKQEKKYI